MEQDLTVHDATALGSVEEVPRIGLEGPTLVTFAMPPLVDVD